jgi:TolB-like protein
MELRRRRVFRVAGLYIVGSWVLLQVAALAFQTLGIPDVSLRWVWIAVIAGFPLTLIFGWLYDITENGIVRTPPADADQTVDLSLKRTDVIILSLLALVAVGIGINLISEVRDAAPESIVPIEIPNKSIAVLPLSNFSGNPEQEYFVAGMHEALIADLARISGLKVISRISTEQYRNSTKTASTIGTELGVAYLIEGSVMRAGDEVRITVQLIDAAGDEHVWSENYQRDLVDVLSLQSNVARAIADQVKVTLTPYEDEQLSVARRVDPEAYELYLKGRFHWYQFSDADLKLALEYFQQSIDKDPTYALAYVGFADALATPAHAEAHDLLARILFAYDWNWDAADRSFRRAINLKPGYPDVHVVYSQFLAITNRWDESLEEARTGVALDPLNPWYRLEYAHRQAWHGEVDAARSGIEELIKRQPDLWVAHGYLWDLAAIEGQFDTAIRAARNYFRLVGEATVASILIDTGDAAEYRELMGRAARELEENAVRPYIANVNLAKVRMHAGDHDAALKLLEEAYRQHETQLGYTTVNPIFKSLWETERYRALRRDINL